MVCRVAVAVPSPGPLVRCRTIRLRLVHCSWGSERHCRHNFARGILSCQGWFRRFTCSHMDQASDRRVIARPAGPAIASGTRRRLRLDSGSDRRSTGGAFAAGADRRQNTGIVAHGFLWRIGRRVCPEPFYRRDVGRGVCRNLPPAASRLGDCWNGGGFRRCSARSYR
jgi:hypothetical protein